MARYSSSGYLSARRVCSGAMIFSLSSLSISPSLASFSSLKKLCRLSDRLRVLGIRPAAAEVAGECLPYLLLGGVRVSVEQGLGGHHKAGCAVTTLHAVVFDVGFNEGMTRRRDPFGRLNSCAVTLDSQHHAGEHRPFVHDHGAGAA